jgi:hypothetical protein
MYHALLPEKSVKALKNEYRVRFLVVLIFFLSLAALVGAIFLLPSYLAATIDENTAIATAATATGKAASTSPEITKDLVVTSGLVSSISSFMSPALSPVVLHLASILPSGITLTTIEVAYQKNASSTLSLSGFAESRDDLVYFRHVLENDPDYGGVSVPISDLAPDSHLPFSFTISAAIP